MLHSDTFSSNKLQFLDDYISGFYYIVYIYHRYIFRLYNGLNSASYLRYKRLFRQDISYGHQLVPTPFFLAVK